MVRHKNLEKIKKSIDDGKHYLLSFHHKDGCFYGECIFNAYANASYLILIDYLNLKHPRKQDIINWLTEHQNADGSWGDILENGKGNYQFTLIATEALREYLQEEKLKKAKQWLMGYRGSKWIDPYTRLSIYMKNKNIELVSPPWWFVFIPRRIGYIFGKLQMSFPKLFWWSIFIYPSTWTKNAAYSLIVAKLMSTPNKSLFKKLILKFLKKKILELQLENGSWYDLGRTTRGAIYALSLLDYGVDSEPIKKGLHFLESRLGARGNINGLRLTVWDTALSLIALNELRDISEIENKVIETSVDFLLKSYSNKGGWSFSYYMKNLPDNDDTSLAILALNKFGQYIRDNRLFLIKKQVLKFLLKMQNDDGGWGAFLKNQCYKYP